MDVVLSQERVMKRALALAFVFFLAESLLAQVRVGVLPLEITGDGSSATGVSAAVFHIELTTLHLLDSFEVVPIADEVTGSLDRLRDIALGESLDYVFFGAHAAHRREVELLVGAYSRSRDLAFEIRRRLPDDAGKYDAAVDLTKDLLSLVAAEDMRFGSIELSTEARSTDLRVFIDELEIAIDASRTNYLLVGSHRVTVSQRRFVGEVTLFDETVDVKDNERSTITFATIGITDAERERFDLIDRQLRDSTDTRDSVSLLETTLAELGVLNWAGLYDDPIRKYSRWLEELTVKRRQVARLLDQGARYPGAIDLSNEPLRPYVFVEALGGNWGSAGIGIALDERTWDVQVHAGYAEYDPERFGETWSWSLGSDVSWHFGTAATRLKPYTGWTYRYNQFENTANTNFNPTHWLGWKLGVEYHWPKATVFVEGGQFQRNFNWEMPNTTASGGLKVWM
jgi:hypothetical protein